jgi:hypothetical protein
MKLFTSLLAILLSITSLEGENVELQTASRSGTHSLDKTDYQKRKVASVKCSAKVERAAGQAPSFQEISVTTEYDTVIEADSALAEKITTLLGSTNIVRTKSEYAYTAWEDDGSPNTVKTGEDSSDDFSKWKKENPRATEVTATPATPCDEANAASPPLPGFWVELVLSRYRTVKTDYKFSYKISFKPASQE